MQPLNVIIVIITLLQGNFHFNKNIPTAFIFVTNCTTSFMPPNATNIMSMTAKRISIL